jgi:class 3 adenylate cyclase/tetratricopeptide (TPR) repeat protein
MTLSPERFGVLRFGDVREGRASGTVTVLFTDLVGSTELMARLGAEAFDTVRKIHFAGLRQAIDRHGGEEIKNTGDGLMATFGSVVDAVRCAVAMQQATDRQARVGPAAMSIRVGVSIGEVTFEDGDVFGPPVVEAARLVVAAEPGAILTTGIARALAGGRAEVEFADLGALELKGLPDPVPACEVIWLPAGPSVPMPALLTDIGRVFVGRDREVERLDQLWKEAAAGELRVALLAGEPGVGKTRLAAELADSAHGGGAMVLAGRCDEDLGVPYQPFVEALRHFVGHTAPDGLSERLGRYGAELVRLLPELAQRAAGLPAPLRSDPETERYRLFDAVCAWLAAVSAGEPLLVVLDDLQWAAKPTLLLLRHVVRSPEPMRLLILGTYRDTELSHGHPLVELLADLRRQAGVERISLLGLDQSGVAAFMEQAAGHSLDDDDLSLARAIYEETEGNPFFVREVLRHLTETGAVHQREGRWGTRLPLEEIGIPEGVREVVGRRVSRLSETATRALAVAAVVGLEFELAVVERATGISGGDLVVGLEEAVTARLLVDVPGRAVRYRFAHALVRDTLYRGLSPARRTGVHRQVAEAIEAVHAGRLDDHLPALAHHYSRAAVPAAETDKAVEYATRAADRALEQLANDEAAAYYRQALDLLASTEPCPDNALRLELLISLGEAERRAGDAAHRQTLLDAARLAQERGDVDALARAALANNRGALWSVTGTVDLERVAVLEAAVEAVGRQDSATRARLLANLALELIWVGDRERRVRLSDEALAMARRLDDPATFAHVLVNRAYAIAAPATLRERMARSSELVTLSERLGDPVIASRAWSVRFRAAMEAADIEEADRCLEAAERLAAELSQPALQWMVGMHRAGRVLLAGDIEAAERLIHETLDLGRAAGQPDAPTLFAYQRIRIRFEQGRLGEVTREVAELLAALPRLVMLWPLLALAWTELDQDDQAWDAYEQVAASGFARLPVDSTWLLGVTDCAAVCAHLGDIPRATVLCELLTPYADQMPVGALGTATGSVSYYLGLLATTLQRFDEADTRFSAAQAIHERLGAPAWLARTRLEWARMLLTRGQPGDVDRACDLLGQALQTARELGLGAVERRAVALLQ